MGAVQGVRVPNHEQHDTAVKGWPGLGEWRVPGAAECGLMGLSMCSCVFIAFRMLGPERLLRSYQGF